MTELLQFETRDEAKQYLKDHAEELLKGALDEFCPLTKHDCVERCVCFYPAHITGVGKNNYVNRASCNNAMFHDWQQAQY